MSEAGITAHPARMFQLDGLRGVAAFMIVFYHLDIVYGIGGPFQRGYLFVDLFFLLSGFVLAVSTEKKLLSGIGPIEFTWARFKRLWPLVAVGAGVAVVRAFYIGMADPLTLLWWLALDLAMIPSLTGAGPFYRYNGPQWTLFYELLANFLHALALKKVPTWAMGLLAAVMGGWLVYTVQLHGSDTMGVNAPTAKTWWWALPRVGFSYVLGVWIGRLYKGGLRTPSLPWQLALVLPVAGIAAVPYLPLGKVWGDLAFVMLFLPVMMWLTAMCRPPQSLKAPLEWLGNFSLPLYCVHLTVLVWTKELAGSNSGAVAALAVAIALALSWFFSRVVSFASKPTVAKG
ncbi:acyltransferase [Novosphingobium sp.]|uniref:acyltransferase family protein n=1 Tax=Novosphingobium sp. TaxID=1874826 RepID=UPI0025D1C5C4|nr:acyltransferase [Novosphingobium sp.]MCC6925752.1 acyltransferase [Novosphingobium sp.]